MSSTLSDYFDKLAMEGIHLTDGQKRWYSKRHELLNEDMTREYPSTPQEAFQSSQEGYWYTAQLKELYDSGHVTAVSYDKTLPVHTASDLGQRNYFAMWFFQVNPHGEIMVIDFIQKKDFPLDRQAEMLNQKGYTYGKHIWPHDARARGRGGITYEQQASQYNLRGIVLEQHGIVDGINLVRTLMSKMWFDSAKCKEGLQMLAAYKKKWNNQIGGYMSEEVHDDASDAAAAMRYLCAGLKLVGNTASLQDHYKALNSYMGY